MRVVLRRHALDQIAERGLDPAWVERAALHPDWSEPDPQPGVACHYGSVPEFGGRCCASWSPTAETSATS